MDVSKDTAEARTKTVFDLAALLLNGGFVASSEYAEHSIDDSVISSNSAIVEALYKPWEINPRKKKEKFLLLYTKNGIDVSVLAATYYIKDDFLVIEETKQVFLNPTVKDEAKLVPWVWSGSGLYKVSQYTTQYLEFFLDKYRNRKAYLLSDRCNSYFFEKFKKDVFKIQKIKDREDIKEYGTFISTKSAKERFLNRKIVIESIPPFMDGSYYNKAINFLEIFKGMTDSNNSYTKLISLACDLVERRKLFE